MNATRTHHGEALTPGVNVDPIDVGAGLGVLAQLGYDGATHSMEVEYNLMRWARGEEDRADHSMANSLSGVSFTDWRVVLAPAIAGGRLTLQDTENVSGGTRDDRTTEV